MAATRQLLLSFSPRLGATTSQDMLETAVTENEVILRWVDACGGGYVWEPELFCVTLMEVAIQSDGVDNLCRLVGVEQLAIDATKLSRDELVRLASIPGLRSLVLGGVTLSGAERDALSRLGPVVELATDY